MHRIKNLIGVLILSTLTSVSFAQAAGAGADYNKAERERLQKEAEAQRKRAACMKDCDTIFKGQYAACGGYPLTAQPTCVLNIDKNKAQCYQPCK
jgi:hypothetical protein